MIEKSQVRWIFVAGRFWRVRLCNGGSFHYMDFVKTTDTHDRFKTPCELLH